jgi:hypothetical protein
MSEPTSPLLDQRRAQGFPDGITDPRVWELIQRIASPAGGAR